MKKTQTAITFYREILILVVERVLNKILGYGVMGAHNTLTVAV